MKGQTMEHSYYLHTNGELINKRNHDACDYRDSDFVKMYWQFDPADRESAWALLVEALSIGANLTRIQELAELWNCDDEDALIYAGRLGIDFEVDGSMQCAHLEEYFTDIQSDPVGFGETRLEALADFCKALGFTPTKLHWHATFRQLVEALRQQHAAELLNDLPDGMPLEAPCDGPIEKTERGEA